MPRKIPKKAVTDKNGRTPVVLRPLAQATVRTDQNPRAPAKVRRYQSSLERHLSRVEGLDAVFLSVEDGIVHVYSVVPEFASRLYDRLVKQEEMVEADFPTTVFEFHVRAHQGRKPSHAAPFGAQPVFER